MKAATSLFLSAAATLAAACGGGEPRGALEAAPPDPVEAELTIWPLDHGTGEIVQANLVVARRAGESRAWPCTPGPDPGSWTMPLDGSPAEWVLWVQADGGDDQSFVHLCKGGPEHVAVEMDRNSDCLVELQFQTDSGPVALPPETWTHLRFGPQSADGGQLLRMTFPSRTQTECPPAGFSRARLVLDRQGRYEVHLDDVSGWELEQPVTLEARSGTVASHTLTLQRI